MRRALGLSLALLSPSALTAQGADEATFLVRHGRDEIGREQYRVLEGRGRGQPGSTVAVTAEYPARHPELSVTVLVSRTPGGSLTAFQLERAGRQDTTRILGEVAGGRLTLRIVRGATEAARQLPASGGLIILADSVHTLLAQVGPLATEEGRALTGLHPESGRRISLTATLAPPGASGGRVVDITGDVAGRVTWDAAGRLVRVAVPATGVTAVRADF